MGILTAVLLLSAFCAASADDSYADNPAVQLLQQYVQLNTTTNSDLSQAEEFWRQRAAEAGVEITKYEYAEGYPVLVLKWPGSGGDSSLGSIMLNSHMDVVPANEEDGWTYPPFEAHLDEDGVIWGRGTQDMKSVGLQYYLALKNLKDQNIPLLRDVYMTLMPDEEVGGGNGMQPFLASDEFKALNIALEMDEGSSFPLPLIPVFYQDKVVWQIQVDCYGASGHSSTYPAANDTAMGKCFNVMKKFYEFRQPEYTKSLSAGVMNAGVYTSANLNVISGGTANNVIAGHVSLVIDIRPSTTLDEDVLDAQIRQWLNESGTDIELTYILKNQQSPATRLAHNPFWTTFADVTEQLGINVAPLITPGSTDARYVRKAGYPAFGFSPMPNTELLLHSVNERLSAETFLRGIEIYQALIEAFANIPGDQTSADPSDYIVRTTS